MALFNRPVGQPPQLCPKSTCLFPSFAQYLTDGFIRTRMPNTSAGDPEHLRRQNTSNHQIDLCTLYGRTPEQINEALLQKKIIGGLPLQRFYPELENGMLFCATEMSRREKLDTVAEVFAK